MTKQTDDVECALATIRPAMQADGGDVELVTVEDGVVSVRLKGACLGCPSASLTMRTGIERTIRGRARGHGRRTRPLNSAGGADTVRNGAT
jgi:Fe-S cluster biogenesis protein NfuA